jgi:hypothetical protein
MEDKKKKYKVIVTTWVREQEKNGTRYRGNRNRHKINKKNEKETTVGFSVWSSTGRQ